MFQKSLSSKRFHDIIKFGKVYDECFRESIMASISGFPLCQRRNDARSSDASDTSVPHIVLISLCCVACLIAFREALLLEVPLITACLLTALQPKQEKRENHDETVKEELS